MPHKIEYLDKSNELIIFFSKNENIDFSTTEEKNISISKKQDKLQAIKISDYLNENERDGFLGEFKFKQILDGSNIPYLYVGQSIEGLEKSSILLAQYKVQRPDFLVRFPQIGSIFVDVKCRTDTGFKNNDTSCFYLSEKEIAKLYNLEKELLLPVWICFINRNELSKKIKDLDIFMYPIQNIHKLFEQCKTKLKSKGKGEYINFIHLFRIPKRLCYKTSYEFRIPLISNSNIEKKDIEEFIENYISFYSELKFSMEEKIRRQEIYKSNLPEILRKDNLSFCFEKDIQVVLEYYIEKGIIGYKASKYLTWKK